MPLMPAPTQETLAGLAGLATRIVVGVGEFGVSNNPGALFTTYSLGSCLGVTIYDPVTRAGGLLHAMLPDSAINLDKARQQPAMFMDSGLPALFRAVYNLKANKHRVQICVAGGAQLMDQGAVFNIGQRNYEALASILRENDLRLQAEHVGGLVSRTMMLHLATGEVRLKIGGVPGEMVLFKG
jgi:chemotaxis protein CheD